MPRLNARPSLRSGRLAGCASLLGLLAGPAAADVRDEVRINEDGPEGRIRIEARGQTFDLFAYSAHVVAAEGSFVLISVPSGGTGCPVSHQWLDLSGSGAVLSEEFGACAERLDARPSENGAVVLRATTAGGPVDFLYAGGATVERREAPLEAGGIATDVSGADLEGLSTYDLFTAAEWEPKLLDLLGAEAASDMQFYMTGPGDSFERDGSWWAAFACGRSMCNIRYMAMAVQPDTGAILVARRGDGSDGGFQAWGVPDGPLPDKIADVVRQSAAPGEMAWGFSLLPDEYRPGLQELMRREGVYNSSIDGEFSPGTQAGMVELAIAKAGQFGAIPDLTRGEAVRTFLFQTMVKETGAPAYAAPSEPHPFEGEWDCEGSTYTFTRDRYYPGGDTGLPYRSVEATSDASSFGLTFEDGCRLGLLDVQEDSLIWSSPASGDIFECARLSGPVELAEAADPAAEMAESATAPGDITLETPTATTLPDEPQATEPPADEAPIKIQGLWSCDGRLYVLSAKTAASVEDAYSAAVTGVSEDPDGDVTLSLEDGLVVRLEDITASRMNMEIAALNQAMTCERSE